ncbi:MAG: capsular biosynthesis protein [Planctomycetaceae bacterium]|nr:capsular biosynthesis protein [Planctomycetaceae bacterium]
MNDPAPSPAARSASAPPPGGVDLHCHVLPGLDDGPQTLDESRALCAALAADGIGTVIASPHQLGPYDLDNDGPEIRAAVVELSAALGDLPLRILPGGDVRIDERLPQLVDEGQVLTVADAGTHLLLELPHSSYLDPLGTIEQLADRGIQTIMTHPERHRYLAQSQRRLAAWVDAGALLQITAGSLLGDFGRTARAVAWRLVDEGLAALVATDAHDTRRRPPRRTAARQLLAEAFSEDLAARLVDDTPQRILAGQWIKEW